MHVSHSKDAETTDAGMHTKLARVWNHQRSECHKQFAPAADPIGPVTDQIRPVIDPIRPMTDPIRSMTDLFRPMTNPNSAND